MDPRLPSLLPATETFEKYFPSQPEQDKLRSAPIPPTAVAAV